MPNIEPTTISRIIDQLSIDPNVFHLIGALIEQTTNRRFINQLSIDPNTPIPPRAPIPLKTLLVAAVPLLVFAVLFGISLPSNDPEWRSLGRLLRLFWLVVSAIPVVIALKGMQLIRVRWLVLSLPLLVVATLALFGVARLELNGVDDTLTICAVLSFCIFSLITLLIADGVVSWPFVVPMLPLSLLVFGGVGVLSIMMTKASYGYVGVVDQILRARQDNNNTSPTQRVRTSVERELDD
ncbi:hypothetical protein BLNAU_11788 [Blattamonas nauphoetae]|uniref:DUF1616 domain-containing protein n=1 Tax=Blattamonas nauphoetae TaxID=2049346 RepID=A0ABQ9XQ51_9EUKA|nr:hypothetical protein BLNAU_11788 [Blattamonas nauphoetae]